jgi:hypothetical protein
MNLDPLLGDAGINRSLSQTSAPTRARSTGVVAVQMGL